MSWDKANSVKSFDPARGNAPDIRTAAKDATQALKLLRKALGVGPLQELVYRTTCQAGSDADDVNGLPFHCVASTMRQETMVTRTSI